MRTVGEILKKARLEKRLSFEDVEGKIRIRKKYLIALEENAWQKLPSLAYIKGFLKNYSDFLNLNSNEMLAVFRRQYLYNEKDDIVPEGVSTPINAPKMRFTPQSVFLFLGAAALIAFFVNLGLQYRSIINPPQLSITRPNEGEILTSQSLDIKGKTDPDAVVEINNKQIIISETGEFSSTFTLQPGINTIVIESTSKHGKKNTVSRTVTVEQDNEEF